MADYKATPEQWDALEKCSHAWPGSWGPCILELRARVEALEAAQPKQIIQEELAKLLAQPAPVVPLTTASACSLVERVADGISKPLQLTPEQAQQISDLLAPEPRRNHPAKPDSSLVERVSCAIDGQINPDQWLHQDAARAAIREVAAWMTSNPDVYFPPALVFALEQEAER